MLAAITGNLRLSCHCSEKEVTLLLIMFSR